jgi:hypothetical protein
VKSVSKCGILGSLICGDASKYFSRGSVRGYCADNTLEEVCNGSLKSYITGTSANNGYVQYDKVTCAITESVGTVSCLDEEGHSIPGIAAWEEVTLTDEYTTADLIDNAFGLISGEDYSAYANASSYLLAGYDLSSDEVTVDLIEKKFRFRHKVSKVGSGCYRILYDVVTIPAALGPGVGSLSVDKPLGGYTPGTVFDVFISEPNTGSNTSAYLQATATATANSEGILEFEMTEQGDGYGPDVTASVDGHSLIVHLFGATMGEYVWDKVTPPGYNPDDSDTWPQSAEVETELPVDPAEIWLMNARALCRGCT